MLRSIGNPVGGLVIAKGRTDLDFYWNSALFFVFPICVYIGCLHSVIAATFTQLLMILLNYVPSWYFLIRKLIDVKLLEYIKQSFIYLSFSSIAAIITYWVLHFISSECNNILKVIFGLLSFGFVYLLLISLFNKKMVSFLQSLRH